MKGEKVRLNFPADPHLSNGDSELTQQLLQEWRNNAFDFKAIGIFELLRVLELCVEFRRKRFTNDVERVATDNELSVTPQ
ncbi:hypothetical protein RHGRI_000615 [Rhododendron griersonianum]|uniref:Uncharacterized protein n=1 Tax=Rhododendron griersonianum TaxID=479676 RepID=A0AAV6LJK2_9ERIC|nr:hypothetical protein RHGRI_000615 [Rhododendron griersonianum]